MDPHRLNAGWGVRTLSQAAAAYNPFDYQTGAVWPHDSAMVAVGLRSYGFDDEALAILTGLYEATPRDGGSPSLGSTSTASPSCSPVLTERHMANPCDTPWPAARRPGPRGACRIS